MVERYSLFLFVLLFLAACAPERPVTPVAAFSTPSSVSVAACPPGARLENHTPKQLTPETFITRTATPNPADMAQFQTEGAKITPSTPTPTLVITKHTDLSPELDDNQKYYVLVTHADGTNEDYKIGPTVPINQITELPGAICARMNLTPTDRIVEWYDIGSYNVMRNQWKAIATMMARPTDTPPPPRPTGTDTVSPYPPGQAPSPPPTITLFATPRAYP